VTGAVDLGTAGDPVDDGAVDDGVVDVDFADVHRALEHYASRGWSRSCR
jgi:hypothetical protein